MYICFYLIESMREEFITTLICKKHKKIKYRDCVTRNRGSEIYKVINYQSKLSSTISQNRAEKI